MNQCELISIVTAASRIKGLKKVIECIDNQTYKQWQHIIVNDNVEEIRKELPSLCKGEKRQYIDLGATTNLYGGPARNIGAMFSFSYLRERHRENGIWVCFLDDDNLWLPNHLETLIEAHKQKPEAVLLGVDMERRGKKNPKSKKIIPCKIYSDNCDLGSFLYRKELFDKYGYFRSRKEKKITFDYELIQKIVDGEGMNKVNIIHKPTFIYFNKRY